MTLNELKKEVLALNFDVELESYDAFIFATNRALLEIYSEKERVQTLKIYKKRLDFIEHFEKLSHQGGIDLTLELNAKAFSLTAVGEGRLFFGDGADTEEIVFSGEDVVIKRKIKTGVAFLRFSGEFSYEIYKLTSFPDLMGEKNDDVPLFENFERFDIKKRDERFFTFSSEAKDSHGMTIPGAKTEGSTLLLPSEYEGEVSVSYKRLPRKILENDVDCEIDISDECAHLLALRVAAYLALDGNEELAEYYLSLYKSGMSALKLQARKATSEKYSDVLGWA